MADRVVEQQLFSIQETATALGLSERKVWGMVHSREIESVKIGKRLIKISKKTIEKVIANGTVPVRRQYKN